MNYIKTTILISMCIIGIAVSFLTGNAVCVGAKLLQSKTTSPTAMEREYSDYTSRSMDLTFEPEESNHLLSTPPSSCGYIIETPGMFFTKAFDGSIEYYSYSDKSSEKMLSLYVSSDEILLICHTSEKDTHYSEEYTDSMQFTNALLPIIDYANSLNFTVADITPQYAYYDTQMSTFETTGDTCISDTGSPPRTIKSLNTDDSLSTEDFSMILDKDGNLQSFTHTVGGLVIIGSAIYDVYIEMPEISDSSLIMDEKEANEAVILLGMLSHIY